MYMNVHIHIYILMCVYICMYVYILMCVHMYVCLCMYEYIQYEGVFMTEFNVNSNLLGGIQLQWGSECHTKRRTTAFTLDACIVKHTQELLCLCQQSMYF